MTNPRSKKESVSETTKSYLLEIYIAEVFGRDKEIESKFLDKGNYAEEDSLNLVTKVDDKLYIKNKERISNEFIIGTPDVIVEDKIIDIKTSWDIWTFAKADGSNKDYYWQLLGYMALTGKKKARLVYTLVNTPEHLIVSEKTRRMYKYMLEDGSDEMALMEEQVEREMTFDDIDEKLRIKSFEFDYIQKDYDLLIERIASCRHYLNEIQGL
jgi:hypothetical protein